jgi:hypothetical protein
MSPLHRNDSSSIVACVFVAARMCLPSRCPATGLHASQYLRVCSRQHSRLYTEIKAASKISDFFTDIIPLKTWEWGG